MSKKLQGIYDLREKFLVIGLTGRTGSGCSNVAKILNSNSISDIDGLVKPKSVAEFNHNNDRKYSIAFSYAEKNWEPFQIISYKKILTLIITSYNYKTFRQLVNRVVNANSIQPALFDEPKNIALIDSIKVVFEDWRVKINGIGCDLHQIDDRSKLRKLYDIFFSKEFDDYSNEFHDLLSQISVIDRIRILQSVANTLREAGTILKLKPEIEGVYVYRVAEIINKVIKAYRDNNENSTGEARIVIDSLRNSLEIRFFKERYSAFYSLSVNASAEAREYNLKQHYKGDFEQIIQIDDEEYKSDGDDFFKQDVASCIQMSDIHLNNTSAEKKVNSDFSLEDFTLTQYLIQYISLILHPGIITPSREERCMQIAYSAKYNSGCISRQVGAIVTDSFYSVKGIGWNNTAEGQVPCLLRSLENLIKKEDKRAFSEYELNNSKFRDTASSYLIDDDQLDGRNCSFCFKDIQNALEKQKNQVHTRSLHAEENAFLQIAKYGGGPLKGGILFTTASPCELCAKKAYQLGIEKIFYIDPYPGISMSHILGGGDNCPKLVLFSGAIGRAYHKLYEPFMSHKDELRILRSVKKLK